MLNRSALIVRPAQPFLDWALQLDDSELSPKVDGEQTVYLIPEFGNEAEQRQVLQEVFSSIFESELYAWHLEKSDWPQKRTLSMFRQWFRIEMYSVVEDLCAYPVEDDDDESDA